MVLSTAWTFPEHHAPGHESLPGSAGFSGLPSESDGMEAQASARSGSAGWSVIAVLGFVLLGTVFFVLGRLTGERTFDMASIACSSVAALTLVVAARGSKRSTAPGT